MKKKETPEIIELYREYAKTSTIRADLLPWHILIIENFIDNVLTPKGLGIRELTNDKGSIILSVYPPISRGQGG